MEKLTLDDLISEKQQGLDGTPLSIENPVTSTYQVLSDTSHIDFKFDLDLVERLVRNGDELVIYLESGEIIRLAEYFLVFDEALLAKLDFSPSAAAGLSAAGTASAAGGGLVAAGAMAAGGGSSTSSLEAANVIPTVDAVLSNDGGLLLSGSAALGATVDVVVAGAKYRVYADSETGRWSLDVIEQDPISGELGDLEDGTYDVQVTATDPKGNVLTDETAGEAVIDSSIDAPTVEGQTPIEPSPTLTGTAEAGATVLVTVGGAVFSAIADESGNWSVDTGSQTPTSGTFTPLTPGMHDVTVVATDAAGNASEPVMATIDFEAPDAPTIDPTDGTELSGFGEPGAEVTVTYGDPQVTLTAVVGPKGDWSVTPEPTIPKGMELTATQTDPSGNRSGPNTETVDSEAPLVVISELVTGLETVVSGTASEPNTEVEIFDGQGNQLGTTTTNAQGSWTFEPSVPLAENSEIEARQQDALGNEGSATRVVALDTDSDGTPNSVDIDDDNDGILDINELGGPIALDLSALFGSQISVDAEFNILELPATGLVQNQADIDLGDRTVSLEAVFVRDGSDVARQGGDAEGNLLLGGFTTDVVIPGEPPSAPASEFGDHVDFTMGEPLVVQFTHETTVHGDFDPVLGSNGDEFRLEALGGFTVHDPDGQLNIESNENGILIFTETAGPNIPAEQATWIITTNEPVANFSVRADTDSAAPVKISVLDPDFDNDVINDSLDTDSDNGGIGDNVEAQNDQAYVAPTGVDSDGDGLDDAYDQDLNGAAGSVGLTPADTDDDGIADAFQGTPGSDAFPVSINPTATGGETLISGTGVPGSTITLDVAIVDGNGDAITEVTVNENGAWEAIPATPLANDTEVTATQTINAPHPNAGDESTATLEIALDFDGDGVSNADDIDDDNDGILDVNELDWKPLDFSVFSAASPTVAPFTVGGETVTVTSIVNASVSPAMGGDAEGNLLLGDASTDEPDATTGDDIDLAFSDPTKVRITDEDGAGSFNSAIGPIGGDQVQLEAVGGFTVNDPLGLINVISNEGDVLIYEPAPQAEPETTTSAQIDGQDFEILSNQAVSMLNVQADGDGLAPIKVMVLGDADTDGDGTPNNLETDSDNGGLSDNVEAQNGQAYVAPSGVDSDGDGLDDAYDQDLNGADGSIGLVPADTGGDGTADAYQGAADSDALPVSINPLVTGGGTLISGTGVPGSTITLDVAIVDDEGAAVTEVTVDEDGNWEAIPATPLEDDTQVTATQTINAPHPNEGDEQSATETLALDFDADGVRNTVDIDDDNDGILDVNEGPFLDTSANGFWFESTTGTSVGLGGMTATVDGNTGSSNGNAATFTGDENGEAEITYALVLGEGQIADTFELYGKAGGGLQESVRDYDLEIFNADGEVVFTGSNSLPEPTNYSDNQPSINLSGFELSEGAYTVNLTVRSPMMREDNPYFPRMDMELAEVRFTDGGTPLVFSGASSPVYGGNDIENDGGINSLDTDSDNGGIGDNVEAQNDQVYVAPSGVDSDDDGLDDAYDQKLNGAEGSIGLVPADTDGDGTADVYQGAANSDALPFKMSTSLTGGQTSINGNGVPGSTITLDVAIVDGEGAAITEVTVDADGKWEAIAATVLADDTEVTATQTINAPHPLADEQQTATETLVLDFDGDGMRDTLDLDDDNDGILDIAEYGGLTFVSSNMVPYFTNGTYQDPNETVDANLNGNNGILFNTTAGGEPNTQFVYSLTLTEGQTADGFQMFGQVASASSSVETYRLEIFDESGAQVFSGDAAYGGPIPAGSTLDIAGFSIGEGLYTVNLTILAPAITTTEFSEIRFTDGGAPLVIGQSNDTDGDGYINHLDTDADGGGIADIVENGGVDADGDGMMDALPVDTVIDGQNMNGFNFVQEQVFNQPIDGNYRSIGQPGGWTEISGYNANETDVTHTTTQAGELTSVGFTVADRSESFELNVTVTNVDTGESVSASVDVVGSTGPLAIYASQNVVFEFADMLGFAEGQQLAFDISTPDTVTADIERAADTDFEWANGTTGNPINIAVGINPFQSSTVTTYTNDTETIMVATPASDPENATIITKVPGDWTEVIPAAVDADANNVPDFLDVTGGSDIYPLTIDPLMAAHPAVMDGSAPDGARTLVTGTGIPGSTISIGVSVNSVGDDVIVDDDGNWSFTPNAPLAEGTIVTATQSNVPDMPDAGGSVNQTVVLDFDDDGVRNAVDIDDDNDGILDADEGIWELGEFEALTTGASIMFDDLSGTMPGGLSDNSVPEHVTGGSAISFGSDFSGVQLVADGTEQTFQFPKGTGAADTLEEALAIGSYVDFSFTTADDASRALAMSQFTTGITRGFSGTMTVIVNGEEVVSSGLVSHAAATLDLSDSPVALLNDAENTVRVVFHDDDKNNFFSVNGFGLQLSSADFVWNEDADTDGDGTPNSLDTDADNGGIADIVENGGVDTDGDGMVDGPFVDANGDGLDDRLNNVELVAGGDFSTADAAWTVTGTNTVISNGTNGKLTINAGNVPAASDGTASQTISTKEDQSYTLSFDIFNTNINGKFVADVIGLNGEVLATDEFTAAETSGQLSFVADSGNVTIVFRDTSGTGGNSSDIGVDNVSVLADQGGLAALDADSNGTADFLEAPGGSDEYPFVIDPVSSAAPEAMDGSEPAGARTVITGTGIPGATIMVAAGGADLAAETVTVDEDGNWSFVPDAPIAGDTVVSATMTPTGDYADLGATTFDQTIALDFDGDGVRDTVDIDDDNDGILDVDESIPGFSDYYVPDYDDGNASYEIPMIMFDHNLTTYPGTLENNYLPDDVASGTAIVIGDGLGDAQTGTSLTVDAAALGAETAQEALDNDVYFEMSFTTADTPDSVLALSQFSTFDPSFGGQVAVMLNGVQISEFTMTSGSDFQQFDLPGAPFDLEDGTEYTITLVPFGNTGSETGTVAFDGFGFNFEMKDIIDVLDVDGDGTINSLDTDADNGGILDNAEAQNDQNYVAPTGVDSDGDGLDDAYDQDLNVADGSIGLVPADTDDDGTSDVYQGEPDMDGVPVEITNATTSIIEGTSVPGGVITLDINGTDYGPIEVDGNGNWEYSVEPMTPQITEVKFAGSGENNAEFIELYVPVTADLNSYALSFYQLDGTLMDNTFSSFFPDIAEFTLQDVMDQVVAETGAATGSVPTTVVGGLPMSIGLADDGSYIFTVPAGGGYTSDGISASGVALTQLNTPGDLSSGTVLQAYDYDFDNVEPTVTADATEGVAAGTEFTVIDQPADTNQSIQLTQLGTSVPGPITQGVVYVETFTGTVSATVEDTLGNSGEAGPVDILLDSDGDGVADVTDIDDDNDGILDTVESGREIGTYTAEGFVWFDHDSLPFPGGFQGNTSNGAIIATDGATPMSFGAGAGAAESGDATAFDATALQHATVQDALDNEVYVELNFSTVDDPNLAVAFTDFRTRPDSFDGRFAIILDGAIVADFAVSAADGTANGYTNLFAFAENVELGVGTDHTVLVVPYANTGGNVVDHFDFGVSTAPVTVLFDPDVDDDGIINSLDTDSDNGGVSDNVEAQYGTTYVAPTGLDDDGDGLDNAYEGAGDEGLDPNATGTNHVLISNGVGIEDTDGDGISNSYDLDDDGDGLTDRVENSPIAAGTPGVADSFGANPGAYLHVIAPGSGSSLNYYDPFANEFVQIGQTANYRYFSAGFDEDSGFVYASVYHGSSGTDSLGNTVGHGDLVRIDRDGETFLVGLHGTSAPNLASRQWTTAYKALAGEVHDGELYTSDGNGRIKVYDLSHNDPTTSAVVRSFEIDNPKTGNDILITADGTGYMIRSGVVISFDATTANGTVIANGTQTTAPAELGGGSNSLFSAVNPDTGVTEHFALVDGNGSFYRLDGLGTATPTATLVGDTSGYVYGDSAGSPLAYNPFTTDAPDADGDSTPDSLDTVFDLTADTITDLASGAAAPSAGDSMVQFSTSGLKLDLTAVPDVIANVDTVDLDLTGANTLTLELSDLLDITDASDTLLVDGNSDDTVNVSGMTASGGTQVINGVEYTEYTGGTGTLLVDDEITTNVI